MFEFVIPARNEGDRVGALITRLRATHGTAARIVVADNASDDATAEAAKAAGADDVVHVGRVGKGFAVTAALKSCTGALVMLCDADIQGLDRASVTELLAAVRDRGVPLGRLDLRRSPEDAPVTTLTAGPLLRLLGAGPTREPLGGLMVLDRAFALGLHLPGDWGFDVALTLAGLDRAGEIPEHAAPGVVHRRRPLGAYQAMAEQVGAAILRHHRLLPWDHANCTRCPA
ncbi:glycosyltransferase [Streptomyces sp. NPDC003717]|uniref:glycosyltransferase family 2 protein n=1 Tax=Streptomyces sp. NPDC003717 TaxID=3154276 RepID=UPI0033B26DB0